MRTWLKGLLAGVIGGAATSGLAAIADPAHFNLSGDGLVALGKMAAAGAIVALLMYLKQSPLPPEEK